MSAKKCHCNCCITHAERITVLEERLRGISKEVSIQHTNQYEKYKKSFHKINYTLGKISLFLCIVGFLFRNKTRTVISLVVFFIVSSVYFMLLDAWNSKYFQYGHYQNFIVNVVAFLQSF